MSNAVIQTGSFLMLLFALAVCFNLFLYVPQWSSYLRLIFAII